jgi:hypothetical protein
MHKPSRAQSTDKRVSTSRAHVVYDMVTGEVLHVHLTVVFPHGAPARESPDAQARRFAGKRAGANAAVMEVDPAEVNHSHPIRIDVATRKVVPKQTTPTTQRR